MKKSDVIFLINRSKETGRNIRISNYRSSAGDLLELVVKPSPSYRDILVEAIKEAKEHGERWLKEAGFEEEVIKVALQEQLDSWQKSANGETTRAYSMDIDRDQECPHVGSSEQGIQLLQLLLISQTVIEPSGVEKKATVSAPKTRAKAELRSRTGVEAYRAKWELKEGVTLDLV